MEILEYAFMQRAFTMGILLAAIIPCIGPVTIRKCLSIIGDALSHTSLAGVATGLLLGLNPVLTTAAACVAAAIGIEAVRRKILRFSEISIAIIMSVGIGLAGVLLRLIKNIVNFNSFLFGSIMAISNEELRLVIAVSMAVLLMFLLMYKELFYVFLDGQSARLAGVSVKVVNFLFTVLIAATVSVAVRTMGALIASSMMVVPVVCAIQSGTNYRQTFILAMVLDILFMITGLFVVYYLELKPGSTIVLVGILVLILISAGKRILR